MSNPVSQAADHTSLWLGTVGNWSDPANWDTPTAPGTFPNNGASTYAAVLGAGGTATLDQDIELESLDFSNAVVNGDFNLALTSHLLWTGGVMEGAGTTSVAGAGSIISGDGFKNLGRVLTNSGTFSFTSSDLTTPLFFGTSASSPGVLNNNGTFNVTAGGDFFPNFSPDGQAINNSGTWNVSGAGTTSTVANILFNNTGTVNVQSGTFSLQGGGTSAGQFAVSSGAVLGFDGATHDLNTGSNLSGAGTIQFQGGTTQFNAGTYNVTGSTHVNGGTAVFDSDATTVTLDISNGTLTGSGLLSVTGDLLWTAGVMDGTGATSVAGTGSTLSGDGFRNLGRVLTNTGTLNFTSSDLTTPLFFGSSPTSPGVLNNNGTFNVTAGGDFFPNFSPDGQAINNTGTWNVSGAGTTSTVSNLPFNNTGSVNVQNGTLSLQGGGTSTGSFAVASGAVLSFGGATHDLNTGTSVSGLGTVQFQGGTTQFNDGTYAVAGSTQVNGGTAVFDSDATTGTLDISNGTLTGSGLLSVTGNLLWSAGVMDGTGTTSVAGTGSTLSGDGFKNLGRILTNTGTLNFTSSDLTTPLFFGTSPSSPGVLNNNGTFNVTAGGDFFPNFSPDGQAINNTGTWNVSGAGTTSTVNSLPFSNTGAVNVQSGTFSMVSTSVIQYTNDSLTAGIWRVFAGSQLDLPTTDAGVISNAADITLSGAGSLFRSGASNLNLENTLTSNSGALRVLAGRNYASLGALGNTGDLQLGGGTFSAPGLTNAASGEIFGFGSISIRPVNNGMVRSSGGTLAFGNGILGSTTATLQIDPGSTIDLSAGASNSSTGLLVHNGSTPGSLALGSNNLTVSSDYTNASFGEGNGFTPRANVSGSGQILASGGIAQTVTGNVSAGTTATPTVAFGNIHVGDQATRTIQVNNVGASGPSLRGALQTSVNGANITDTRLSGSGVTAGNFGPIAPGAATAGLSMTFDGTSAGALTGQAVHLTNNFDNVIDQTILLSGAAYRFAQPTAHSPEPINFGNFHVGDAAPSQALSLTNSAPNDGFSESLNLSIGGPTGGVTTNSGTVSLLAPGATNNSSLSVGINTATAGSKNGTATLTLTSDGTGSSGLGLTPLPSQTVNVTGSVFRLAQPTAHSPEPINFGNFHVGDAAPSQALTLTNSAPNDGFSESLNLSIGGPTGGVTTNSGSVSLLAPGATNNSSLSVGINTATAGSKNGTAALTLTSDGTGSSGLGLTPLPSQTVNVTGTVFRLAQPSLPSGNAVDFGIVHVGDLVEQPLGITNAAANDGFSESLNGSVSSVSGDIGGVGTFTGLGAGGTSNALTISINTATAGTKSGSATLAFQSDGTGSSGLGTSELPNQNVTVSALVNDYANPVFLLDGGPATLSGFGGSYTLDFGARVFGDPAPVAQLSLLNDVDAPADSLAGSFDANAPRFMLTGFDAFSGVAAGQARSGLSAMLLTDVVGQFEQTVVLQGFGQNESGYNGALPQVTLTLRGEVVVPEPGAAALLGFCMLGIVWRRRR